MLGIEDDTTRSLENRTEFLNAMILSVADTLRHNLGAEHAETMIALVAHRLGEVFNDHYHLEHDTAALSLDQVAQALVDLKRRIEGGFRIVSMTDSRIVLRNDRCPFGLGALGRPELCQMTAGVFGRIASENLGYARVDVRAAIARGDRECHVVIDLLPEVAGGAADDDEPVEPIEFYGAEP